MRETNLLTYESQNDSSTGETSKQEPKRVLSISLSLKLYN